MNPNPPFASRDKLPPIPEEFTSLVTGKTIRPLDPSPPRDPVPDRRDNRDPREMEDEVRRQLAEIRHTSNGEVPTKVHTDDSKDFLERAQRNYPK